MAKKDKGNGESKADSTTEQAVADAGTQQEFAIQKLYVRDISFESPNATEMFQSEWKPEIKVDLQTTGNVLSDNVHEAVLSLTVTAKNADKVAFIAEVKKAGVFTIKNYPEDQIKHILATVCPNILFPYAREVVSDLIIRGGFPTLYLNPVNFDALYAQQKAQQTQATETETSN